MVAITAAAPSRYAAMQRSRFLRRTSSSSVIGSRITSSGRTQLHSAISTPESACQPVPSSMAQASDANASPMKQSSVRELAASPHSAGSRHSSVTAAQAASRPSHSRRMMRYTENTRSCVNAMLTA